MRGKNCIVFLVFLLALYPVLALDNLMALQGMVEESGQPLNGNLTITVWNQSSGGTLIYDSGSDFNNKIVDGRFDIMIGQVTDLTLEYGKYYYMDMSVNDQDLDFNGSERQIFQSSLGMINKNYIYSTGTWDEQEIPSLTSSWTGTIDSSKIVGSLSLNVNNSQYLSGLTKDDFLNNDTQLSNRINAVNASIGSISGKLDATDQRYNETSKINAVNTTSNIQTLGFNTTTQLNTLYYLVTNPSNYVTTAVSTLSNYYLKTQVYNKSEVYNKTESDNMYYSSTNPSSYISDGNTNWDNTYDLINSTYANNTYVRIGTSCQCSNIADRMYNFTVNSNGLCTAVCGSDATGGGVLSGMELTDLFSRKYYYREAMFESVTSGYNEPWIGTAISSGTTALVAAENAEHPGTASMSTSTTASSGYSYQITGTTTYLLGVNYTTRVVFKPLTKTGNVTYIRFGFQDIFTSTGLPADGVFFNITQNSSTTFRVRGHSRSNNAQTNTPTEYMIYNNTWYAAKIYINSSTLTTFEVYNGTHLLWSDTVSSNIPTAAGRQTSNAFVAYTIGGTTAQMLTHIDFISVGINRELIR